MMQVVYQKPSSAIEIFNIADAAYNGSPWSIDAFTHDLANEHANYLVITVDTKPVGFVAGTLIIDELSISNVAIMPAFQRHHLARMLLKTWFEQFDNNTRVLLEVRAHNVAAINLYQQLGFEKIALREAYYQRPVEDALIMEKIL